MQQECVISNVVNWKNNYSNLQSCNFNYQAHSPMCYKHYSGDNKYVTFLLEN